MKRLLIMILIISSSLGFGMFKKIKSEIKLKADEEPRFREVKVIINNETKTRKVIPGKYKIRLFELEYPSGVVNKNHFYNSFGEVLEKVDKNKKYSILLDKTFYEDMQKLKTNELSDEEKVLELPASSLEGDNLAELMSLTSDLAISEYLGTDQEYLNRQLYLLYQLLGKEGYNGNNVYSELDKEYLIEELKLKRKKIIENFEKSKFEYFVKESYDNIEFNKFEDDSIYRFDRDIVISENIEDQAILPEIRRQVYLTDFPDSIVDDLAKNRLKLKRNLLLIENDDYHGYTYNENNTIVFINGKSPIYYYDEYKIDIVHEKIEISKLLNVNSNYYISDFFYE